MKIIVMSKFIQSLGPCDDFKTVFSPASTALACCPKDAFPVLDLLTLCFFVTGAMEKQEVVLCPLGCGQLQSYYQYPSVFGHHH